MSSNIGPLTTTYTPIGADCTSTFLGLNGGNKWLQYGVGGASSTPCLPSKFKPYQNFFYSPGLCPSGYTSACQSTNPPLTADAASETTAICCPTSYSCRDDRGDDPFGCLSCFNDAQVFAVSTFFFSTNSDGATTAMAEGTTTETWSENCVRAYAPIVHLKARDMLITSAATADSSTTSIESSRADSGSLVPSETTPAASMETGTMSKDDSGSAALSKSAALGIGISVAVGVILLVGAATCLFIRRRRQKRLTTTSGKSESTQQTCERVGYHQPLQVNYPPPELSSQDYHHPQELSSHRQYELGTGVEHSVRES
ncbi:hypothetical protein F5Y15DRAFT_425405 [Xylariaceae sp. FL0016]|nr:hypothetical protein F5Y15DRAFT_425405 [Xylariaceae sp. FL0016]